MNQAPDTAMPGPAVNVHPDPEASATSADPALIVSPAPVEMTVSARGAALTTIAVLAIIFALQWAQHFFIPLLIGILIAYTLNSPVKWLERLKLPRAVATIIVMVLVLFALTMVARSLGSEVQTIIEQLPEASKRISAAITATTEGPSTMQKVQQAATEIEKATSQVAGDTAAGKQAARPAPAEPPLKLSAMLLAGSRSAATFAGDAMMVTLLVLFLLLSGDTFKRKLVRITGPSLSKRKITVQILDEINTAVQRYMFMLLVTNLILALLTWIAFRMIGLQNAGAWAVAAGFLHIIPYFGPIVTALATGTAALMQFGTVSSALLVVASSVTIATIVGTVMTTWMAGRIARMNSAAVFIALLFWGWLWGIWGLLLAIPIIVIVKVVAQHVEGLGAVSELLGE